MQQDHLIRIAPTPQPPYYAVIFTSIRTLVDDDCYHLMAELLVTLALRQEGYLGIESARNELGVTISYWLSTDAIMRWKQEVTHEAAQKLGREKWYEEYKVRICKVEHDYGLIREGSP